VIRLALKGGLVVPTREPETSHLPTVEVLTDSGNAQEGYLFGFGACGTTWVLVLSSSVERALECAADWLLENKPGLIVAHGSEDDESNEDGEFVDHIYTEAGWLPSWEWTVDDYDSPYEVLAMQAYIEGGVYFDRFDIMSAWYLFLSTHHEGQGSKRHERLSRMTEVYKPSWSERHGALNEENALRIYGRLLIKEAGIDPDS